MAGRMISELSDATSLQNTDLIPLARGATTLKVSGSTLVHSVTSVVPGTVTNVTGTAPISVANGTTTPAISIAAATTSAAGSMSSTDKTRLDDASGVNGIVQCNGSGDFAAAVAGTDYSSAIQGAKAWAMLNGSNPPNTVVNSFNISTIAIAGNFFRLTFSSPMPNANYAILISTIAVGTAWGMPVYHYANRNVNYFDVAFGDSDNPLNLYQASTDFSIAVFGN